MRQRYRVVRDNPPAAPQNSEKWKEERVERVTSSNFGTVCRMRDSTPRINAVKNLLYSQFNGNASTVYGHEQEAVSERLYSDHILSLGASNVKFSHPGLVMFDNHPELGASPDAVVTLNPNGSGLPATILLEYKNPKSLVDNKISVENAVTQVKGFPLTRSDDSFNLKQTHKFYYQIQGALHATGIDMAHLIIRGFESMAVVEVKRDTEFMKSCIPILRKFYFNFILPEISHPLLQHGGIRDSIDLEPDDFVKSL